MEPDDMIDHMQQWFLNTILQNICSLTTQNRRGWFTCTLLSIQYIFQYFEKDACYWFLSCFGSYFIFFKDILLPNDLTLMYFCLAGTYKIV